MHTSTSRILVVTDDVRAAGRRAPVVMADVSDEASYITGAFLDISGGC